MWEFFLDSESIDLEAVPSAMVYSLQFADEPMLLVRYNEDSSIGLEPKSSVPVKATSTRSSRSKRRSKKST